MKKLIKQSVFYILLISVPFILMLAATYVKLLASESRFLQASVEKSLITHHNFLSDASKMIVTTDMLNQKYQKQAFSSAIFALSGHLLPRGVFITEVSFVADKDKLRIKGKTINNSLAENYWNNILSQDVFKNVNIEFSSLPNKTLKPFTITTKLRYE